jgi:hypothetical protein
VGQAFSFQLTADNNPTSFAIASGNLPAGLTLNSSTGLVSGTPNEEGTFGVNFTAANGNGTGPAQTVRFTIDLDPPTITSPAVALGTIGTAFSFTVTASPNPTAFSIASGTLPTGLSLSAASGEISGTPTVSGSFVLQVQARNSKGLGATSSLTLSIPRRAPVIRTEDLVTGNAEQPYSFTIQAANEPDSFTATGLPAGLSINSAGLISGTPQAAFNGSITVTAANSAGPASKTFPLVINPSQTRLTSTNRYSLFRGDPVEISLEYDKPAAEVVSAVRENFPPGLTLETNGLIRGTPTQATNNQRTIIDLIRRGSTNNAELRFTITPVGLTEATVRAVVGEPLETKLEVQSPFARTFEVDPTKPLPAGLTLSPGGLLAGQIGTPGTNRSTLRLIRGGDEAEAELTVIVSRSPPVFLTEESQTIQGGQGDPLDVQLLANFSDGLDFSVDSQKPLPEGLRLSSSGRITGTPLSAETVESQILIGRRGETTPNTVQFEIREAPPVLLVRSNIETTLGSPADHTLQTEPATGVSFALAQGASLPAGLRLQPEGRVVGLPVEKLTAPFPVNILAIYKARTNLLSVSIRVATPPILFDAGTNNVFNFRRGENFRVRVQAPTGFTLALPESELLLVNLLWNGEAILGRFESPTTGQGLSLPLKARLQTADGEAEISATMTLQVPADPADLSSTPRGIEVEVGKPTSISLPFGGTDTLLTATSLPPGLVLANGVLTGINTSTNGPAEWQATLTADNSGLTGGINISQPLTIRLRNPVPVLTSARKIITGQGRSASLDLRFDALSVDRIRVSGLPAGVSLVDRRLTVSTNLDPGVYRVTAISENLQEPGNSASNLQTASGDILIFVDNAPPTAVATAVPAAVQIAANAPVAEVRLIPEDAGARVAGYGLPSGVTIDPATGVVSGTPTESGNFNATIFVQNGKRWLKKKLAFLVR